MPVRRGDDLVVLVRGERELRRGLIPVLAGLLELLVAGVLVKPQVYERVPGLQAPAKIVPTPHSRQAVLGRRPFVESLMNGGIFLGDAGNRRRGDVKIVDSLRHGKLVKNEVLAGM